MNLRMLMQDNYDQGVADAEARAQKAIAKAEAKAKEEKACNIRNLYSAGVNVNVISKSFNISEPEVRNILSAK